MQLYHCRALPCKVLHQSVDHLKHVVLLTPSFAQMSELTQGNFIEAISVRLQNSLPPPTQLDLPVSTPDWERKTVFRFAIHSFWRNIIFHFLRHYGRKIWIVWEYSHANLTDFPTLSSTAPLCIQWLTQVRGSSYKYPISAWYAVKPTSYSNPTTSCVRERITLPIL